MQIHAFLIIFEGMQDLYQKENYAQINGTTLKPKRNESEINDDIHRSSTLSSNVIDDDQSLSIYVVSMDYRMQQADQTHQFVQRYDTPVPVVRIFGSTDAGQRVCLNMHGVNLLA